MNQSSAHEHWAWSDITLWKHIHYTLRILLHPLFIAQKWSNLSITRPKVFLLLDQVYQVPTMVNFMSASDFIKLLNSYAPLVEGVKLCLSCAPLIWLKSPKISHGLWVTWFTVRNSHNILCSWSLSGPYTAVRNNSLPSCIMALQCIQFWERDKTEISKFSFQNKINPPFLPTTSTQLYKTLL